MYFKSLILFLIVVICVNHSLFSQDKDTIAAVTYYDEDQIIYELTYNHWLVAPADAKNHWNSLSSNLGLMYPFIGRYKSVSIASGLIISSMHFRTNVYPFYDWNRDYTELKVLPDSIDYKDNILTTSYIDLPLEIRLMTKPNERNRSLKLTIGAKAGYLLSRKVKYNGEIFDRPNEYNKYKLYKIHNIMHYRYGVYARLGYGQICLSVFYSLSPLFEENLGPEIIPVTVGITLIPF